MIDRETLEKTPLLFSLNDEEIEEILIYFKEKDFSDEDIIFEEGDKASYLCIVASGKVGIAKKNNKGEFTIVWELFVNMVFGELALFDGQPRSGSALAIGETTIYYLYLEDFIKMVNEKPKLALKLTINVAKILAGYLRKSNIKFYQAIDAMQAKSKY